MPRRSDPIQTFDMNAVAPANFARPPMDDGEMAKAAGLMVASIGQSLAKLAKAGEDKALAASVEAAGQQGATDAAAAAGMPKIAAGAKGVQGTAVAARQFFEKQGWTPVQAAAIVGNLIQESSLRTTAANPQDPGTSIGIGQWNRERKAALLDFAKKRGTDWHDFTTQLAFVHQELTTTEKAAGNQLRSATTIEDAVSAAIGYERPKGWTSNNPQGGHGYDNRLRNARMALAATGGGISVTLPEIKPLQLRKDGTPQGDAYDTALLKTGGYRAKVAMQTGLDALAEQFAGDPEGFTREAEKLRKSYVGFFAQAPELQAVADAEFQLNAQPVLRQIYDARDRKANEDMKDAATEAVASQNALLDRQAYNLGVNGDGDQQLAALQSRAMNVIDDALKIGAISSAEAVRQREAVAGRLVQSRFDGVFDALKSPAEKQAFAEKLASPEMRTELLQKMPEADYNTIVMRYRDRSRQATDEFDAQNRVEKERFTKLIADDVASVGATGTGVSVGGLPLAGSDVARVLGPEQAQAWSAARGEALQLYTFSSGLSKLTPEQMQQRLADVAPKAGAEGFSDRQQTFGKAAQMADRILKNRAEDPAQAVDETFPELQDAQLRKDPAKLAEARMAHQAALGIPELARQPLTNAEAQRFAQRLTMYQDDPKALNEVVIGMAKEFGQNFGAYGDDAMAQVLRVNGVANDTARLGVQVMKKIGLGQPVPAADARALDKATSRDAADQAMRGQTKPTAPAAPLARGGTASLQKPKPGQVNAAAVEHLRNNPDLAPDFDRKYGAGLAQQYLQPPQDSSLRRLPDGSWERTYPNGWVETTRPDGSIEGRMGN